MILVAVGTTHFNSLVERVDAIAPRLSDEVVMQIGTCQTEPKNTKFFRFSPTFGDHITRASIVISHGGYGIMTEALERGKKIIGVENTELFDNHQAELLWKFEKEGYILWCRDLSDLETAIGEVASRSFRPYTRPECSIGDRIRDFLDETVGQRQ